MEQPEIITVDHEETTVACDGGETFGHPKVYLTIGPGGYVDCYYCGRRFLRDPAQTVQLGTKTPRA